MLIPDATTLDGIEDFLVGLLTKQTLGIAFLLLLLEETGAPLPVPGDLIIAYVGYQVSQGLLPYPVAYAVIMLAVLIGATILYSLSARFGQLIVLKLGRFIHVSEKRLVSVEKIFNKYGPLAIIFGRHIIGFRSPITIFSGMSKVTYKTFIASVLVSTMFWIPFYMYVGQKLGPKTIKLLSGKNGHYFIFLIPILLLIFLLLYIHSYRKAKKEQGKA
jgi:membrane protein DedA with SNARE-associated domain